MHGGTESPSPPDRAPRGGGGVCNLVCEGRPAAKNRCTHLCPVLRQMPYVRPSLAWSQRPPASQSSMNCLRSCTDPVSFQAILEVSPIRSHRCVTYQTGSYRVCPCEACHRRNGMPCLSIPRNRRHGPSRRPALAAAPRCIAKGCGHSFLGHRDDRNAMPREGASLGAARHLAALSGHPD